MKRRHLLQAAAAALGLPAIVRAQTLSDQADPLHRARWPPGGGNDMIARVVTERWGKALGQNFVVENQSGGGGVIACQTTARAPADGYTLMQGYVATHGTTPATRRVAYDAIKDFTPIGMIGATPNVLAINDNVPAKTIKEFIDYVKRNPGKVSYGSAGPGLADAHDDGAVQAGDGRVHAAHPLSRHRAGHHRPARRPDAGDVPRPGGGAAAPALGPDAGAGGHRHAAQPAAEGRADDGRGRLQGLRCDAVVRLGRPGGPAADVVRRLNETQVAVLKAPDLAERLAGEAVEPWPMSPEQFGQYIRADIERWTTLAKARGIRLDE